MFVLFRTLTYATLFIALVLIYLPARVLAWAGVARPAVIAWPQICGLILIAFGALVALHCVLTFAWIGKGTPAPFDPPRHLVVSGPYRSVRNPMYIGAATALAGAALFFESAALLAFAVGFLITAHLFVVLYEEPTLRRTFGVEYHVYCETVHRWLPMRSRDAIRRHERIILNWPR